MRDLTMPINGSFSNKNSVITFNPIFDLKVRKYQLPALVIRSNANYQLKRAIPSSDYYTETDTGCVNYPITPLCTSVICYNWPAYLVTGTYYFYSSSGCWTPVPYIKITCENVVFQNNNDTQSYTLDELIIMTVGWWSGVGKNKGTTVWAVSSSLPESAFTLLGTVNFENVNIAPVTGENDNGCWLKPNMTALCPDITPTFPTNTLGLYNDCPACF